MYTPSGHVPVSVGCCVLFTFELSCVVFCLDVLRYLLCIVYPRVFQFLCVVCLRVYQVLCVVKLLSRAVYRVLRDFWVSCVT